MAAPLILRNMTSLLISTELQREEEEQRKVPITADDPSNPFYDVARHGIIQVSGQDGSEPSQLLGFYCSGRVQEGAWSSRLHQNILTFDLLSTL